MSKKKDLPFTLKELNEYPQEDIRLNLIQSGDDVYRCTVDEKKKFLGLFFERWVHRADLMKPIREVDDEIQKAKDKLAELEVKRDVKVREARVLAASIGHSYNKPYNLNSAKDSKPTPVKGVFNTDPEVKKDKPKQKPRVLEGKKCVNEPKQNNGKRNN